MRASAFNKTQSGQALLLVMLSMAVAMVVVLSIVSNSITNVSISSRGEEALRAFSAAEAGIEKSLIAGSGVSGNFEGSTFTSTISGFAQGSTSFVFPQELFSGDTASVWLVSHASDGSWMCDATHPCFAGKKIKVCWGNIGTNGNDATAPALEMSLFYTSIPGDYSTAKIARATFDPNSSRRGSNSFAAPDSGSCTIGAQTFPFQKTIDLQTDLLITPAIYTVSNNLQFAKIRTMYSAAISTPFGVDIQFPENNNAVLPSQGTQAESTGISGGAERKVQVFRSFAQIPSIFDSVLFSPGGIAQ